MGVLVGSGVGVWVGTSVSVDGGTAVSDDKGVGVLAGVGVGVLVGAGVGVGVGEGAGVGVSVGAGVGVGDGVGVAEGTGVAVSGDVGVSVSAGFSISGGGSSLHAARVVVMRTASRPLRIARLTRVSTNSAAKRAGWSAGISSSRVGGSSHARSRVISRNGIARLPMSSAKRPTRLVHYRLSAKTFETATWMKSLAGDTARSFKPADWSEDAGHPASAAGKPVCNPAETETEERDEKGR